VWTGVFLTSVEEFFFASATGSRFVVRSAMLKAGGLWHSRSLPVGSLGDPIWRLPAASFNSLGPGKQNYRRETRTDEDRSDKDGQRGDEWPIRGQQLEVDVVENKANGTQPEDTQRP
jgi:hypothetical protein